MIYWLVYLIVLALAVFLDYKFFASSQHQSAYRKALQSISFWGLITLSTVIFIFIAYEHDLFQSFFSHDMEFGGWQAVGYFITGYLVEQSLSIDNIFVIAFLLSYFKVPQRNQASLLSIGIWTAIILRGILIIAGIWLIQTIDWMVFVLGILLIISGIKIYQSDPENPDDPAKSWIIRLVRRLFPVTKGYFGSRFVVRRMGKLAVTPLFLTLVTIEFTDILFALDSIPAIFAITTDPFLVLSSNILAVANLRALYTILSRMLEKLEYIHYALAILLVLIGIKIIVGHYVKVPEWISFGMIVLCIGGGALYSLWRTSAEKED